MAFYYLWFIRLSGDAMVVSIFGIALSGIWLLIAAAVAIFVVWKLGKLVLKIVFGVIANTILGFISLFLANSIFGFSIPFSLPVIVSTALFGLGGVGTIIILQLFGITV
jgi:hypothetical protein